MTTRMRRHSARTPVTIGLLAVGMILGGCALLGLVAPGVPTGVDASDGNFLDRIAIVWESVTGATTYEVWRAPSEDGSYEKIGETPGTTYSDDTVTPNTTYWYRVKACNRSGCSDLSTADSGYAAGEGISQVPTGVSATDGTYTDRVRVTWTASPGATSYEVWRDVARGGPYNLRGMVSGTTYDDRDASPGVVYWYKVKACNASGCSAFSAPDSGFTFASAPDPVTNVSATDGTYTDRVRVTWTAVTGAANYEVHRAESEGGTYTRRATVTGASYDDTGVTQGTTYWYKVTACNTAGCSAFSVPDSGYASTGGGGGGGGGGGTGDLPGQPQNVTATDGTHADKIRVTWSSVSGATSYRVYRSDDSTFNITTDQIAETTTTSFDDVDHATNNPLELCEDYWYAVSAMNATGEGPLSVPDVGYQGTRVTGVPTVSATNGLHATKIVVTWNEIKGATTYEVWRAESFGGPYIWVGEVVNEAEEEEDDEDTTVTFEDDTFLDGDHAVANYWEKTFYYRVKACGEEETACGCGGFSAPASGYVRRTPDAPTNVEATDGDPSDKVVITWDAAARATSYEVYRATSQTGTYTKIRSIIAPTDSTFQVTYNDTTATPGITYWYKVSACNDYGCGPMSAPDSGYRTPPPL
jgi:fibronectin type 3 domain-containing protein